MDPVAAPLPDVALAQQWAAAGRHTQLQGAVAQRLGTRTVALYAALTAVVALCGHVWPVICFVLLVLIVFSALVDLDGGRGWVRGLSIAEPTHNVIAWPDRTEPGPTLIVTAPLDATASTGAISTTLLSVPLALAALAAVGTVLDPLAPSVGTPLLVGSAAALLLTALLALGLGAMSVRRADNNPARAALLAAMAHLERSPTKRLRCVFALIGGGTAHHDGIEVFLENHRAVLPPAQTRILVVHPHREPLGLSPLEGRVRPRQADPMLVTALRDQGFPDRKVTTAAARALRLGWPAAALTVGSEQINAGGQAIARLAEALDAELPPEGA